MRIIQKVYYSISNSIVTENHLSEILEPARKANIKKNITGCLLYHDKIFLQLLEGEESKVNALLKNIEKDNRHKDVTIIYEEEIKDRFFPNWSMAFHELSEKDKKVNQFIKSIKFYSENNDKQSEAIQIFWNMAKQIVN